MIRSLLRPFRRTTRTIVPELKRGALPDASGRLRLSADAAVFEIPGAAAAGWVSIGIRVGSTARGARARLVAQTETGSPATAGVLLGPDGRGRGVMHVPAGTDTLRLEIDSVSEIDPPEVRIRTVSGLEATTFLGLRLLLQRLREPRELAAAF